jgi:hypothetical protein
MRITKAIAEHVAKCMTAPEDKVIKELRIELQKSVKKNYIESLPVDVIKVSKNYPLYFRRTSGVTNYQIGGFVPFFNEYNDSESDLFPEKAHSQYLPSDAEIKLFQRKDKLKSQYRKLNTEIQQALLGLGSYKRVSEQFPEAVPHLPKLGRTEIMIDIASLRGRISQSKTA